MAVWSQVSVKRISQHVSRLGKSLKGRFWLIFRCLLIVSTLAAGEAWGLWHPLNDLLQELRINVSQHKPSGEIVFVAIDEKSLQQIGVWPWPRSIHADIIDRLMDLGASSVVLDIDFSSNSQPKEDEALARALKRAGGYVSLALFQQQATAGGNWAINMPIEAFARVAPLVAVQVPLFSNDFVRDYPYLQRIGAVDYPSVGSALQRIQATANAAEHYRGGFGIDFSIDAKAIDIVSVSAILDGSVDPARIAGKDIVVGSTAQELRDFFTVPHYGLIPGAMLHILAAETLKQGHMQTFVPFSALITVLIVLAGLAVVFQNRLVRPKFLFAAAVLALVVELGAIFVQHRWSLRIDSGIFHLAFLDFLVNAVISDLVIRRRLHRQASRQRDHVRRMLDQVIQDNFDAVLIVDEARRIVKSSSMACEILGSRLVGDLACDVLPGELCQAVEEVLAAPHSASRCFSSGELSFKGKQIKPLILEYVVTASALGAKGADRVTCVTFRDVTQRRTQEARLRYLAQNEPLTDTSTRPHFIELLHERATGSSSQNVTLLVLNVRRFHVINEFYGHETGERLLQNLVARLRELGIDMISRLGGAVFAMAIFDTGSEDECRQLCQTILAASQKVFTIFDHKILVTLALGAINCEPCGLDVDTALMQANIAASDALKRPGNNFEIYTAQMEEAMRKRQNLESDLRTALSEGQLSLQFQPQFDLNTGQLHGAEALVRWHHPTRGCVAPADFIPVAEETGQIVEIGRWVLRQACLQAASWPLPLKLSVNVSPIQFQNLDMEHEVIQSLARSGLSPSRLGLEITEGVFIAGGQEVNLVVDKLRRLGVRLALDDFGTGYSSLSYLQQIDFDEIKIDRSFVMGIDTGEEARAILETIVTLAHRLGKEIIVEGVETHHQADFLRALGCQFVQGYLFSRPLTLQAFEDFQRCHSAQAQRLRA